MRNMKKRKRERVASEPTTWRQRASHALAHVLAVGEFAELVDEVQSRLWWQLDMIFTSTSRTDRLRSKPL